MDGNGNVTFTRYTIADLLEEAWGLIANAGMGDWEKETPEWRIAAGRWRDEYHTALPELLAKK